MATIEETHQDETGSYGVEYHEDTREHGYRFVKNARSVVIERGEETEFRHVASRMITPFRDLAYTYDLADRAATSEWDRRRRMLATVTDNWLDGLGLRTDRQDAHRIWTEEDTPHLICRYSRSFQTVVNGSGFKAPAKFLALGRGFQSDHGIAVIGNALDDDNLDNLARKCVAEGMGLSQFRDVEPDKCSFLVMDLDRATVQEGGFSTFKDALEDTFRLW